jgi:hypothetical protein
MTDYTETDWFLAGVDERLREDLNNDHGEVGGPWYFFDRTEFLAHTHDEGW